MTDHSTCRRLIQLGALFLIGDGLMGILMPRRRSLLWQVGPPLAKAVTEEIADHPRTARTVNLAKAAIGLVLITRR